MYYVDCRNVQWRKVVKKLLFVFLIPYLAVNLFAKEINISRIYLYDAETMTVDKNNKYRYSPLKSFDNNDETVFAFKPQFKYGNRVYRIHFDMNYPIDEIKIKAGYFDKKYYSQNHRIKKITLIFNEGKFDSRLPVAKYSFNLEDVMKEQSLTFPKIECNEIWVCVDEIYKSEKYNDICISELSFFNAEEKYKTQIRPSSYGMSEYKYDNNGNLIEEHLKADHINYIIKYSTNNIGAYEGYTTFLDYEDNQEITKKIKTIYPLKNNEELIEQLYGTKIKHIYKDNKLFKTEVSEDNETYSINYYYDNNNKLSHTDFGEFFYENGLLKGYFSYDYYSVDEVVEKLEKIERIFCSYYLEYNENNQVIKQYVSSWNGYTGVK